MFEAYTFVFLLVAAPTLTSSRVSRDVNDWYDYGSPPRNNFRDRLPTRMGTTTFNYDNPADWGSTYSSCNGRYQSPIDIRLDYLENRYVKRSLKWHNMEKIPSRMNLQKSEIVLEMKPEWKSRKDAPYLTGGPLNETYYFYNVHFHWDTGNDAGSEHAVDGKRYPMEVHAVYTSNPQGVLTSNDRILVTAFMITISDNHNFGLEPVINAVSTGGKASDGNIPIQPFPLKQIGLSFCADYVIYSGSLTTPPCTQGVTWIISSQTINLSHRQYRQLKNSLMGQGGHRTSNNRPLQRLNGRKIFYVVAPPCPPKSRTLLAPQKNEMVRVLVNAS